MITEEEAKEIVYKYIINRGAYTLNNKMPDDDFVILDSMTIRKDYGWMFIVNSKKYLETREFNDHPFGIGPMLVEKDSGNIYEFATAAFPEDYLEEYEIKKGIKKPGLLKWLKIYIFDRYWFLRILS